MSCCSQVLSVPCSASAFVAALVPAASRPSRRSTKPPSDTTTYIRIRVRSCGIPAKLTRTRRLRSYLDYGDPGVGPDYTSNLYMEDTAYPQYLLGPGIFQRLLTSPGQYN